MKAGLARVLPGLVLIGLLFSFVHLVGQSFAQTALNVQLQIVKYGELAEAVRAQKGKVLVIDVWADFCIPCKEEFPNLVRLHKKYAEKGLNCFSVSVDPPNNPTAKDRVKKFLEKQQATFANFFLDEPEGVWQNRWDLNGPPCVFVFDRQGKRAAKFEVDVTTKPFTYTDVEKLVVELLERKP